MSAEAVEAALDDPLGDELLGLIFAACHPVISPEARAALTLRLVGGLTVEEIAARSCPNEATIAAPDYAREKGDCQGGGWRSRFRAGRSFRRGWGRCSEVVYLIFNEGYAATAGPSLRPSARCAARRSGWGASLPD